MRSRYAAEHDRLDMLDPAHRGAPFRARPSYAELLLEQRFCLAARHLGAARRQRRGWARAARAAAGAGARPVDSICEDLVSHVGELSLARLAVSRSMVRV